MAIELRNIDPVIFLHNVGIGTTSPNTRLHVTTSGGNQMVLEDSAAGLNLKKWILNSEAGTLGVKLVNDAFSSSQTFVSVLSSGNVGIGTTSPTYRLHVRGANASPQLFVGHDNGGGGIFFHAQGDSAHLNWLVGQQRTIGGLEFTPSTVAGGTTFDVPAMVILSSTGNVGIGTTSPSARLDVYSATNLGAGANGIRVQRPGSYGQYGYLEYLVSSDMTVLGSLYTGGGAGAFGQLTFRQHSSTTSRDAMVLNSLGNLGIGTTAPSALLHLYANNAVTSAPGLKIEQAGTGDAQIHFLLPGATDWAIGVDNSDSDQFKIGYANDLANSNVVTIKTTGNVGVGTTNPINKLHLYNGTESVGATQLELEGRFNAYGAGINFSSRTSSGGTLVAMAKITADGEDAWNTTGTTQAAGLRFSTTLNGTLGERLRIHSNGNVGIGTTVPSEKLHVAGQIYSSSGGIRFPDGTVQSTAATGGLSFAGSAQVFTSNGTFTVPMGVTKIKVTVTGGGSGGGFRKTIGRSDVSQAGGAAGGTAIKWLIVTPGTQCAVVVGAGGVGGSNTSTRGSASSFTHNSVIYTGGIAGDFPHRDNSNYLSGSETFQSGGEGTNGDLNLSGGDGSAGSEGGASYWGGGFGAGGKQFGNGKPGVVVIEY